MSGKFQHDPKTQAWLYGAYHWHGLLYTKETKQSLEAWLRRTAEQKKLKEYLEQHDACSFANTRKGKYQWPCLSFGPTDPEELVSVKLKVGQEEVEFIGMKWPLSRKLVKQSEFWWAEEAEDIKLEKKFQTLASQDVRSWLCGEKEENARVVMIQDQRHPAFSKIKKSFCVLAKSNVSRGQMVGPVYGGVLRRDSETDELEMKFPSPMTTMKPSGSPDSISANDLFNRWSYAYEVKMELNPTLVRTEVSAVKKAKRKTLKPIGRKNGVKPGERKEFVGTTTSEDSSGNDSDESHLAEPCTTLAEDKERSRISGLIEKKVIEPIQNVAIWPEVTNKKAENIGWNIDAAEARNELAMVNDPTGMNEICSFSDGFVQAPNVEAKVLYIYNVPHVCFIAKRDIKKDEEILVDYGGHYWERLKMLSYTNNFYVEAVHNFNSQIRRNQLLKASVDVSSHSVHQLEVELLAAKEHLVRQSRILENAADQYKAGMEQNRLYMEQTVVEADTIVKQKTSELAAMQREADRAEKELKIGLERVDELAELKEKQAQKLREQASQLEKATSERLRLELETLIRESRATLGGTTVYMTQPICVYSAVAESMGLGTTHVVGDRPQSHFESSCKFRKMDIVSSHVVICESCGCRFRKGLYAHDAHKLQCETFRRQREGEELSGTKLVQPATDLDEAARRTAYGSRSTNRMIYDSLWEGLENDWQVAALLRGFLSSIIKTMGDVKGVGDELFVDTVSSAMGVEATELPLRLASLEALCKSINDAKVKLLFLTGNCPPDLRWIFDFSTKFYEHCKKRPFSQVKKVDKEEKLAARLAENSVDENNHDADVTDDMIWDLCTLAKAAKAKTLAAQQLRADNFPLIQLDISMTVKPPVTSLLHKLHADLPWPDRPLPGRKRLSVMLSRNCKKLKQPQEPSPVKQEYGEESAAQYAMEQLVVTGLCCLSVRVMTMKDLNRESENVSVVGEDEGELFLTATSPLNGEGLASIRQLTTSIQRFSPDYTWTPHTGGRGLTAVNASLGVRFQSHQSIVDIPVGSGADLGLKGGQWGLDLLVVTDFKADGIARILDGPIGQQLRQTAPPGNRFLWYEMPLALADDEDVPLLSICHRWNLESRRPTFVGTSYFVYNNRGSDLMPSEEFSPKLEDLMDRRHLTRVILGWDPGTGCFTLVDIGKGQTYVGRRGVQGRSGVTRVSSLGGRPPNGSIRYNKLYESKANGWFVSGTCKGVTLIHFKIIQGDGHDCGGVTVGRSPKDH